MYIKDMENHHHPAGNKKNIIVLTFLFEVYAQRRKRER